MTRPRRVRVYPTVPIVRALWDWLRSNGGARRDIDPPTIVKTPKRAGYMPWIKER